MRGYLVGLAVSHSHPEILRVMKPACSSNPAFSFACRAFASHPECLFRSADVKSGSSICLSGLLDPTGIIRVSKSRGHRSDAFCHPHPLPACRPPVECRSLPELLEILPESYIACLARCALCFDPKQTLCSCWDRSRSISVRPVPPKTADTLEPTAQRGREPGDSSVSRSARKHQPFLNPETGESEPPQCIFNLL